LDNATEHWLYHDSPAAAVIVRWTQAARNWTTSCDDHLDLKNGPIRRSRDDAREAHRRARLDWVYQQTKRMADARGVISLKLLPGLRYGLRMLRQTRIYGGRRVGDCSGVGINVGIFSVLNGARCVCFRFLAPNKAGQHRSESFTEDSSATRHNVQHFPTRNIDYRDHNTSSRDF